MAINSIAILNVVIIIFTRIHWGVGRWIHMRYIDPLLQLTTL